MHQAQVRTLNNTAHSSLSWSPDTYYDSNARFAEIGMALLPAAFILAVATALLLALL